MTLCQGLRLIRGGVHEAQAEHGELAGKHVGLAGKNLAGRVDPTLQDQCRQLAGGFVHRGDGRLRVAGLRADLSTQKIGGPGDIFAGNGTQGIAQSGE